jgi:hypothetical protein
MTDQTKSQTPTSLRQSEKLAYSIREFCELTSLCRGQVSIERAAGRLRTISVGRRVLIPADAAQAFLSQSR